MRVVQDMRNHVHPSMRGVVKRATAFVSLALCGEKPQSDRRATCVRVSVSVAKFGGKLHTRKGAQYANVFKNSLRAHPNALAGDKAAARKVLNDLQSALRGDK